jgi:hypothetical protein
MDKIELLISWLEAIDKDESPSIPFNLHPLVRALSQELGPEIAVKLLKQLQAYKDTE